MVTKIQRPITQLVMTKLIWITMFIVLGLQFVPVNAQSELRESDVMLSYVTHHEINGIKFFEMTFSQPYYGTEECPVWSDFGKVRAVYDPYISYEVIEFVWACDEYDTNLWTHYVEGMMTVYLSNNGVHPNYEPPYPYDTWNSVYIGLRNVKYWGTEGYNGPFEIRIPTVMNEHAS